MQIRQAVEELIQMVEDQRFLEAIAKFYAEDATMQENSSEPRVGLPALLENEEQALATRLKDFHICGADSYIVDGDRAAINWVFEYTDYEGKRHRLDEIAYQLWRDGKIVKERFFYG